MLIDVIFRKKLTNISYIILWVLIFTCQWKNSQPKKCNRNGCKGKETRNGYCIIWYIIKFQQESNYLEWGYISVRNQRKSETLQLALTHIIPTSALCTYHAPTYLSVVKDLKKATKPKRSQYVDLLVGEEDHEEATELYHVTLTSMIHSPLWYVIV